MVKQAHRELVKGISAQGRSKAAKRRGLWAIKKKNGGKFPTHPKQKKDVKEAPAPKFYPPEDVKKPLPRKMIRRQTKLRTSLTPGTIVIILSGRFKGKRAIFLGQLPSGLLLVSGPYGVNGVPARRVNQAYVIATSTKVKLPANLNLEQFTDSYFKTAEKKGKEQSKGKKKTSEGFFAEETGKKELPANYIENQKSLDAQIIPALSQDLKGYLASLFTLRDGDRPHLMKF